MGGGDVSFLLLRLGIIARGPFDIGPTRFLSRRHPRPDGCGSSTSDRGFLGDRSGNFTSSNGIELGLQRLDLLLDSEDFVELGYR